MTLRFCLMLMAVLLSGCSITFRDLPIEIRFRDSATPTAVSATRRTPTPSAAPITDVTSPALPADLTSAKVTNVVDGDTITVEINGEQETVRMIGVDTPETHHPSKPVECFGQEASDRTTALLSGKQVLLEDDSSQDSRDRYGRLLRFVWLPDGQLINLELIAEGYAYEYTYDLPYKYQQEFRAAQQTAQAAGHGLWAANTCNGAREAGAAAPTPTPHGCPSSVPDTAPNAPITIVSVDKRAETVTLRNTSSATVDVTGWQICSLRGAQLHATLSGSLAAGKQRTVSREGSSDIWSNNVPDDAALFDAQGNLISFWDDQEQ